MPFPREELWVGGSRSSALLPLAVRRRMRIERVPGVWRSSAWIMCADPLYHARVQPFPCACWVQPPRSLVPCNRTVVGS
jgi:hypothetical protein